MPITGRSAAASISLFDLIGVFNISINIMRQIATKRPANKAINVVLHILGEALSALIASLVLIEACTFASLQSSAAARTVAFAAAIHPP